MFGLKKKGDDGRDFITVDLCGDDFLAALADFEKGTEEWDDIQAIESEAQGTLAEMFDKSNPTIDNGFETDDDGDGSRIEVHVIDDSPEPKKNPEIMDLDSSSDLDDFDTQFKVPTRSQTCSRNHSLRSMVRFNIAVTVSWFLEEVIKTNIFVLLRSFICIFAEIYIYIYLCIFLCVETIYIW